MALIWALVVAILCVLGWFKSINEWLPRHKHMKDLIRAELIYRGMRVIAPLFLMYSIVNLKLARGQLLICAVLYGVAYAFKKMVWSLEYNI